MVCEYDDLLILSVSEFKVYLSLVIIIIIFSLEENIWKSHIMFANAGVAYSKHIVHIYSYHGGDDLRNHLEVSIYLCHLFSFGFEHFFEMYS